MKLSSQTEYAILSLLELGQRYGKGYILSREIARSRNIPASLLERVLLSLRKGGLVMSSRGANGGHRLARAPKDINIREVIETIEGSLAPADCVDERLSPMPLCPVVASCAIKELWRKMHYAMLESVENVTLSSLLEQERHNQETAAQYT